MKKIYSVIMLFMLSVLGIAANAETIIVNVDSKDRVYYTYNSTDYEFENDGDNTITVAQYSSIYIKAKDGIFLKSVIKKSTNANVMSSYSKTDCYIYNGTDDGETYTVTSYNADDARNASCTVNVDDASKVSVQRYNNTVVNLENGDNTVKFSSTDEVPFIIRPVMSKPLYKVWLNDVEQASSGTGWNITPANGDVIKIQSKFPDKKESVKFNYENEESQEIITKVTVDGVEVTNYNDENFEVQCGSLIEVFFNTTEYKVDNFKVNGSSQSVYTSYSTYVTGTTTFYVNAHKYAVYKVKLTITDPSHITVYKGEMYNNITYTGLVAGENNLEVPENNSTIQIVANSGCFITSVTDNNDNTYSTNYNNAYVVTCSDGLEVTVVSGAIVRDKTVVVYVDDVTAAGHRYLSRSDRSNINLESGYNVIPFCDGDNDFQIGAYNSPICKLYKDNELVAPAYVGGTYYNLTMADGDVYKLFLKAEPTTYNVTFDVANDAASEVTVTADRITTISNFTETLEAFGGTEIKIAANDADTQITVKVNNEPLTIGEDGAYTFNVAANSNVSVVLGNDGISSIEADAATGNVYNTQGVMVLKAADAQSVNSLPAGIYIMNGKKIVVK